MSGSGVAGLLPGAERDRWLRQGVPRLMLTVCFLLLAQAITVVVMLQQQATAWGLGFIPLFVLLTVAVMWGVRWLLWRRALPGRLFAALWITTAGLLGAAVISATVELGHAISGGVAAFDWEASVTLVLITCGLWFVYLFWRTCVQSSSDAGGVDVAEFGGAYGRIPVPVATVTLGFDDDDDLLSPSASSPPPLRDQQA